MSEKAYARAKIQHLLVTGDNRLKQGVSAEKVRATYEEALEVAREAGLEKSVRPLVEALDRAAAFPPPNLAAREAAAAHGVKRQAARVDEILERAARGRRA